MRVLISDKVETVDNVTGEVYSTTTRRRIVKKCTKFKMMNAENNWHRDIPPTELQLIIEMALFENPKTYFVHMDHDTRTKIAENLKLSQPSIKRLLASLLKTPYLKRKSRGVYMINPDCLWCGSESVKEQKIEMYNEIKND